MLKAVKEREDKYFIKEYGFVLKRGPYYEPRETPKKPASEKIKQIRDYECSGESTEYDSDDEPINKIPRDIKIKGYNTKRLPGIIRSAVLWDWLCSLDYEITACAYAYFYGEGVEPLNLKFPALQSRVGDIISQHGSLLKPTGNNPEQEESAPIFDTTVSTGIRFRLNDPTWNPYSRSTTDIRSNVQLLHATSSETSFTLDSQTQWLPVPPELCTQTELNGSPSNVSMIAWSHSSPDLEMLCSKSEAEDGADMAEQGDTSFKFCGEKDVLKPTVVDESSNEEMSKLGDRITTFLDKVCKRCILISTEKKYHLKSKQEYIVWIWGMSRK